MWAYGSLSLSSCRGHDSPERLGEGMTVGSGAVILAGLLF